jgi:hypothetical protein
MTIMSILLLHLNRKVFFTVIFAAVIHQHLIKESNSATVHIRVGKSDAQLDWPLQLVRKQIDQFVAHPWFTTSIDHENLLSCLGRVSCWETRKKFERVFHPQGE